MNIFLICPVRNITEEEKKAIGSYVETLEAAGHKVHWPPRDTQQNDPVGLRICTDNRQAIENANEVHVWYNSESQGTIFDLGMTFALRKKVVLANPDMVRPTDGKKSFNNVLLALSKENSPR